MTESNRQDSLLCDSEKVDFLELLRILLLQQNNLPPTLQSEMIEEKFTEENIDPQLKFWISVLMTSLAFDDTTREKWTQLSVDVARVLLTDNAQKMLKHSQYQRSLQDFLHHKRDYDWQCKTCLGSPDKMNIHLDILKCEKGHKWPRCCKTMQICDTFKLCQCSWCGSIALPEFAQSNCPLCSGTLHMV